MGILKTVSTNCSHKVSKTQTENTRGARDDYDEARSPELSAHGFRKATGNISAERGATAYEIMEILGVTLFVAEPYTREADARKLADSVFGKAFGSDA